MQLQDIVGEVRKTLGEVEPSGYNSQQPGQGTWDNSQIIGYINEGLRLISHSVRLEGATNPPIALNTATNAYNLPTDCLEDGVRMVVYHTPNAFGPMRVKPISLDEYNNLLMNPPMAAGSPVQSYRYTLWNGQILLTPYPGTDADTLTVYYYKTTIPLANAEDVPVIPERFHPALVYYATALCQKAVEETALYQTEMQAFEAVASQMQSELSRKSRERNRVRRK